MFYYDRRGRGGSSDTKPYAVEREIEDIDALVTEAGGSALLFGQSSGALLVLDTAKKLVGKITKLALYEPAFVADDSRSPLPKDLLVHLKELIDSTHRADAASYFMRKVVNLPDEVVASTKQSPMWAEIIAVAPTLLYDAMLMDEASKESKKQLAKRWETVTISTLVIDGSASWAWTRAAAKTIAEILPNAQRQTLAGQNHSPDPEVLAPVLEQFFIH